MADIEMSIDVAPIRFNLPGHAIDTRLKVFGFEFHVHSLLMQISSKYFRKFLSSPDKTPAAANAPFQYDYDTVVDDDGETWGLEVVSKITERKEVAFTGSSDNESIGFRQMLQCVYSQKFELQDVNQLETMVRLADFYGAVHAASFSLDGLLARSPELVEQIPEDAEQFLESMIHVAGQWNGDSNLGIISERIRVRQNTTLVYAGVMAKVDRANREIMKMIGSDKDHPPPGATKVQKRLVSERVEYHTKNWSQWLQQFDNTSLSYYFRNLYEDGFGVAEMVDNALKYWTIGVRDRVRAALEAVLTSNLALDRGKTRAGERDDFKDYEDRFLCAEVHDEDLPWDLNDDDW